MKRTDDSAPPDAPQGPAPGSARAAPADGVGPRETAGDPNPLAGAAATVFPDPTNASGGPFDSVERLRILETLSYGVLYEGRVFQASRSEEVALLELDAAFERERDAFPRILAELLAASRLPRTSVLAPRGVFRHGDRLYVLFDACPGVSLATAFEFLGPAGLRLSSEAILRIASGVLAALDAPSRAEGEAESAHGLLTPENVFVAQGQRVLVRGFGIWRGGVGRLGLLGPRDRRYIAPSQTSSGVATPRTDLLSLGMILFEGLVGLPAFDSPPEEEDLADLRGSIGEFQAKAEPGLSDLFEITIACLTPPSSLTPAYRARLRKKIDTLFLREFTRDRAPKMITLDDLVSRIKPRRPVIVKARAIALAPAVAEEPRSETSLREAPREEAVDDPATLSIRPDPEKGEAPAAPVRTVTYAPMTFGGPPERRAFSRGAIWAVVVLAALAGAAVVWRSRSASDEQAVPAERVVVLPAPTAAPAPPSPAPPTVTAPAARAPAPQPVARAAERGVERRRRDDAPSRSRRAAMAREPARKREPAPRRERAASSAAGAPAPSPAPQSPPPAGVPVVAAGTLVSFQTAGLVAPVLIVNPEPPRFQESDPRPARPRSAALEILVSDSGRVRGSRILRADRFPPGFTEGIEKYLSAMRFRPAELGGVPVKVWIPFDLRFLAP